MGQTAWDASGMWGLKKGSIGDSLGDGRVGNLVPMMELERCGRICFWDGHLPLLMAGREAVIDNHIWTPG